MGVRRREGGWFEPEEVPPRSPAVRELLAALTSPDAVRRTRGLDGVAEIVMTDGAPSAHAAEALEHLLPLALRPDYPGGSALLARLFSLFARLDDPPRSGGSRGPVYEAFRARGGQLSRHARTTRDPAGARLSALLAARFPALDEETVGLLIALLTGTADPDERGRLLYALARIEASRGGPFHARIAEVLERDGVDAEKVAVALALAEHDPPEPMRGRSIATLERAREMRGLTDPRSWGRRLDPSAIERAVARLQARRGG